MQPSQDQNVSAGLTSTTVEKQVTPDFENNMPKSKNKNRALIIGGIIIALLLIAVMILVLVLMNKFNQPKDSGTTATTTSDNNINTPNPILPQTSPQTGTVIKPSITLATPAEGDSVNGKISVKGKATASLVKLNISLVDSNGTQVAQTTVDLADQSKNIVEGSDVTLVNWSIDLDVITSPTSAEGTLKVLPNNPDLVDIGQEVGVKFSQQSSDRVKISAPLENQVMFGNTLLFAGQMKDFFEGTMNIRLKDESGKIIYDGAITASGDNNGQFADFSSNLTLDKLSTAEGKTGTWEIYETSAKDGSVTVVYSFKVRFL